MRIINNIRYICVSLLALNIVSFPSLPILAEESSKISQDEALFVRRILEFWRDKDFTIVKSQIGQFHKQYPQSEYTDSLWVILGDIHWQEKNYESALTVYKSISKPSYQDKVFNNCLDCLYRLGRYQEITEILPAKMSVRSLDFSDEQQTLWAYYQAEALLNLAKANTDPAQTTEQLKQAKAYFEQLQDTKHKMNAKLGLAEIESLQGNAEQVVQHYIDIAQETPEKKDEMLLRAAQLQAQYEPEIALEELAKIQELYGEFSATAALSRLSILFDLEKYQQIIDEKPQFFQALKTSQHPILYLYVGRSYFNLNQYENALHHFQLLQKPENQLPHEDAYIEKSLLVMMSVCANRLHNLELATSLRQKFQEQYSQDPALAKLLYYEALTLAYYHKYPEALDNFDSILSSYPEDELHADILYEKGIVLFKQGKWLESRASFGELIQKKPDSKLYISAVQYMPYLSMQLLDIAEKQGSEEVLQWRYTLLNDLKTVLKESEHLADIQNAKYTLQLGKVLYDLQTYPEAIETLQQYVEKYPEDDNLFQGHLLLALCYHEGIKDPAQFAKHAETVLKIKPDFADKTRLHMNLFNAYIEIAQNADPQQEYYDLAANHLFEAVKDPQATIKMENQLWLANYFYHKIRAILPDYEIEPLKSPDLKKSAEQAFTIYLHALKPIEEVDFNNENAYLEIEYFKMSNLHGWLANEHEQKRLLAQLLKVQNDHSELKWKLHARALFAFANANLTLNELDEARENYRSLFMSKIADSYVSNASKLQWSRLAFKALPSAQRSIEDPDMLAILKTLKDVQIHKILTQEPLHLEAGIDYVNMRSSIEPVEKRDEQQHFLFKRMKEDFTAKDDMWSKDYAEARLAHPDKNSVVEAYLALIEAHINRLEATLAEKQNLPHPADKLETAKTLYQKLLTDNSTANNYLRQQAESGLQLLQPQ